MMRVLFVCTGNTCRSPLAAAIARESAAARGLRDIEFESAGTSAWDGAPASDGALLVGLERGLDLNAHRARQLTSEIVQSVDLVLSMGPHHLERIQALGGEGKAHLLTSFASHGKNENPVADPFGGDLDAYRAAVDELRVEIDRALERIATAHPSGNS